MDLCPGPFEDTQFDAVIDVETSDDCMDDKGIIDICQNCQNQEPKWKFENMCFKRLATAMLP